MDDKYSIVLTNSADVFENADNNINFISGLGGQDKITNSGRKLTIDAGNDNDSIINSGSYVYIDGGNGNDRITITGTAAGVTAVGGAGADTIETNGKDNLIVYDAGKDVIYNFSGEDSIKFGGTVKSSVQSGADVLITMAENAANILTIKNVSLSNLDLNGDVITYYKNEPKSLTTGHDKYISSRADATVYALKGNDTITVTGNNSYIDGGDGTDKISIGGEASNVTVGGGKGADTIYSNGKDNVILYNAGDGKDVIEGLGGKDSILVNGTISNMVQSNGNVLVTVGSGAANVLTLKNVKLQDLEIDGDVIYHVENIPVSLNPTPDAYLSFKEDATVYAMGGNDTVTVSGNNSYIEGNGGDDKILIQENVANVTAIGGANNDTIYTNGNGNVIVYNAGDGKDIIEGFGGSDSIQINGTISKSAQKGADVIVTVGTAAHLITIKNIKKDDLNFTDGVITFYKNEPITLSPKNDEYLISRADATVYAIGGSDLVTVAGNNSYLDAGAGADKIYIAENTTNLTINGGAGNDTVYAKESSGGNLIVYDSNGGKDVIVGLRDNDSIQVNGTISKSVQSGANVLITVGSGVANVLTLKDFNIKNLKIEDDIITPIVKPIYPHKLTPVGDTYSDEFDGASVDGDAGNDKLTFSGNNVSVFGNAGHDTIYSSGNESTLDGGAGNDVIFNEGNSVYISGGAGDDLITLAASEKNSNSTIAGGAGNDSIYSDGNGNLFLYANNDGNDVIYNFGRNDSIQVTSGNITKSGQGKDVIFKVGNGKITIKYGANYDWQIEDNIIRVKELPILPGTEKNDKLINDATENASSIIAYGGNDTITNKIDETYIDAGKGNDSIVNSGNSSTIIGGEGNDKIILKDAENTTIIYDAGDGNDSIYGFKAGDVIQYSGAIANSVGSNGNTTFSIGSGSIFIQGLETDRVIVENNTISVYEPPVITLTPKADITTISSPFATVYGIGGKDTLTVNTKGVYLDGGDADDTLILEVLSEDVTLVGGKGNDNIYFNDNGSVLLYNSGDGDDVVYDFGKTDSIQVVGEKITTSNVGKDKVFQAGKGKITVKDGADKNWQIDNNIIHIAAPVTITGTEKNDYLVNDENIKAVAILALGGNDRVENYIDEVTIDAGAGNDNVENFGSAASIFGGAGNDKITLKSSYEDSNSTVIGGKGDDTIYSDGNRNLFLYENGDGKDVIVNFGDTDSIAVTTNGKITTIGSGKGNDITFKVGSGSITVKDGKAKDWDIENNVIHVALPPTLFGSEGNDYLVNDENIKAVAIVALGGNDRIENYLDQVTIDAGEGRDRVENFGSAASIFGGAGDDEITLKSSDEYSNSTVIGGKGDDTIYSDGNRNLFLYENGDGKDVIVNFGEKDSIQVTGGKITKTSTGKDAKFKVGSGSGSGSILIKDGANKDWRIESNNIIHIHAVHTLFGSESADELINDEFEDAAGIVAYVGNDTIKNYIDDIKIEAGAGDDSILNSAKNVTIEGGKGADKITLSGSEKVLFVYNSGDGKDVITGFGETDSIKFGGKITSTVKQGKDIVVTFNASNTITLKDVSFRLEDIQISGDNDMLIVEPFEPEYDLTSKADTHTTLSDNVTVHALGGNDKITVAGSYSYIDGGVDADNISLAGNVEYNTIYGGKGNDNIYSNGNFNTIIYNAGDGKDTIWNFSGNDVIKGNGYIRRESQSGADFSVSISGTANVITLKKVNGKDLEIVENESANTFEIYFKNSSSADILDDDNFMSFEAQIADISEITPENYSVAEIQTQNYNSLAQDTNYLAYSDKDK